MLWFLNCGEFFHPRCQPYKKGNDSSDKFWLDRVNVEIFLPAHSLMLF